MSIMLLNWVLLLLFDLVEMLVLLFYLAILLDEGFGVVATHMVILYLVVVHFDVVVVVIDSLTNVCVIFDVFSKIDK